MFMLSEVIDSTLSSSKFQRYISQKNKEIPKTHMKPQKASIAKAVLSKRAKPQ